MPLRLKKYLVRKPIQINNVVETLPKSNIVHYNYEEGLGFIIVRCIKDKKTSMYWHHAYRCIRKFYPINPIVIIDDNSNRRFINHQLEKTLEKCHIIQSDFPGCGECLGYYYFYKHHWFEKAMILHDSVFIQQFIPLDNVVGVKFLWHIETKKCDDVEWETTLLKKLGGPYLSLYEEKECWKGCFGVMSVIEYNFLLKIASIFNLLDSIKSRRDRCCMERIFAVMCFHHCPRLMDNLSIMGDIHQYALPWGYSYMKFLKNESHGNLPDLVKVWTGR